MWETAEVFLALVKTTGDVNVRTAAVNYLLTTQEPNGSWNDDPYSTALALQALHAAQTQTGPPPPATTGTLTGTVADGTTQAPLSNVLVEIAALGLSTTTSASGGFALSNAEEGSHDLTFAKTGYAAGALTVSVEAGSFTNLGTLYMSPGSTGGIINGMVTDASTGNPIAGATVNVTGTATLSTSTASDGTYAFTDVPPGAVTLTSNKTGYEEATATGMVTAGGVLIFSPTLSPAATTGTISGTVTDSEAGVVISGATIDLSGTATATTTSGAGGTYSFNDVPAGGVTLTVSATGFASTAGTGNLIAGTTLVFSPTLVPDGATAPTGGAIRGTVTESGSGVPLDGATVSLTGPATLSTVTGPDGAYEWTDLADGSYTISVTKSGYRSASGSGLVTAGSVLIFNASLSLAPTTGTLIGTVLDAETGLPVSGAVVVQSSLSSTTGADGAFSLADVPQGTQTVSVSASGYQTQTLTLVVTAGVTNDLQELLLTPTPVSSTVAGTVTDSITGNPIPGATLRIIGGASAATGADGTYQIDNVASLAFDLEAAATGYVSRTIGVTVTTPGRIGIDFPLEKVRLGDLAITSLSTDLPTYAAYAPVDISAAVTNAGTEAITATLSVQIRTAGGSLLATIPGPGPTTFSPGIPVSAAFSWDTAAAPPGEYATVLLAADSNGVILAEAAVAFSIAPTVSLSDFAIGAVPRFTHVGAEESVMLSVSMTNRSNVTAAVSVPFEFRSPSGALIQSGMASGTAVPEESIAVLSLSAFSQLFSEGGDYPIHVEVSSDSGPLATLDDAISASGTFRVEVEQSLSPQTVIPDGDKRIRIEIRLEAVEEAP